MQRSFITLTIAGASLMIPYSYELTPYLRMPTDFSGWPVHCEIEPGGFALKKSVTM